MAGEQELVATNYFGVSNSAALGLSGYTFKFVTRKGEKKVAVVYRGEIMATECVKPDGYWRLRGVGAAHIADKFGLFLPNGSGSAWATRWSRAYYGSHQLAALFLRGQY